MGSVDANGVMWNKASVGKLLEPGPEIAHAWSAISKACASYAHLDAVGERSVVECQKVDGFDKYVMSDTFNFTTYADYFKRIEALGSGLAGLGIAAGSRVVVSVELAGGGAAVQLKGSSSQQLRLDPSQTTEIVFEMEAVALGGQKLVARVSEEGAASGATSGDAIEMEFEVKGAQPEVMVATSRAIRATGGVALWSEGISLPAAVPGSGGLNLTVGVGRLPAVLSAATILLDAPTRGGRQPISEAAAPELAVPTPAKVSVGRTWAELRPLGKWLADAGTRSGG